jgi:hypothetical protein
MGSSESTESSLTFSLRELRAMAQQRTAEREQQRQMLALAAAQAQQRLREAELERERAEREAELAAEEQVWQRAVAESKAVAERLEAAERAERARAMITLSQARASTEQELATVERQKRRPAWLLAVTVLLASSSIAMGAMFWQWHEEALAIERHAAAQVAMRQQQDQEREELERRMNAEIGKFDELSKRLSTAQKKLTAADQAAKTKAAKDARAAEAQRRAIEAKRQGDEEQQRKDEERGKPIQLPKGCTTGALC